MKSKELFFIVGMARSGTVWTSQTISSSKKFGVIGESLFWGRNYVYPDDGEYYKEDTANRVMIEFIKNASVVPKKNLSSDFDRDKFDRDVKEFLVGNFDPAANRYTPKDIFDIGMSIFSNVMNKPEIIEKTPHHLLWVDRICESYPNARFIVTIRDPYECMLSYKHQSDRMVGKEKEKISLLYHPAIYPIIWRASYLVAKQVMKNYEDRILIVKNEDIQSNQIATARRIEGFLGLEEGDLTPRERLNSSFETTEKPNLSSADVFWMNLIAGDLVIDYRGSKLDVGYEVGCILLSFLMLPISVFRALRVRMKDSNINIFSYSVHWLKKAFVR